MTGTRCVEITDSSRKEKLGKDNGNRRISVRFYYPGVEEPGKEAKPLLNKNNVKGYGSDPALTAAYNERVKVYEGLQVKEGRYPLVLYSHGYSSCAELNSDLCSYLAEHGYIVASVAHTYEASEVVFDDGTSVKFDKSLYRKMMRPMIPCLIHEMKLLKAEMTAEGALKAFDEHQNKYESFLIDRLPEWAADNRLALAKIREMAEDEGSFLCGKVDLSKGIGMTGHSFGGATAYYQCLYDDDVTCGVNIDGGLFGNFGDKTNKKPFMQIINPLNYNVVTRSFLFAEAPVHFLEFKDMKHVGFCDVKFLTAKEKRVGKSDPVKTMDTLNEAHAAFFDRYLKQGDKENKEPLGINTEVLSNCKVF